VTITVTDVIVIKVTWDTTWVTRDEMALSVTTIKNKVVTINGLEDTRCHKDSRITNTKIKDQLNPLNVVTKVFTY
jgi:hypothetical protein